ncbi:hypothetical protein SMH99_27120 [Spiroplasma poulsonii]|uniref:hypothetical protein n=1 Tax=Spiroplasma poulsonii TaxID=2138 RepID=UPI000D646350|nr:hypothetical protein [Spiroplasma poulsonii]PWF94126.1 hypothetical protein SMH99_27120 [Spiroplasma poulsonii]
MALTKEQLIEQGLSEEIADSILNEFHNETKQIIEGIQKRKDTISKEEYLKIANELDELKAFKDVPATKIEDIKTNLNKVSGSSLSEKMQTLKELKPDLFAQEQQAVSPTNLIKDMIEKSTENKNDEIETIKEKGAYTPDEIKKLTDYTLKNLDNKEWKLWQQLICHKYLLHYKVIQQVKKPMLIWLMLYCVDLYIIDFLHYLLKNCKYL